MRQQVSRQHRKKYGHWNSRYGRAQRSHRQEMHQGAQHNKRSSPPENDEPPTAQTSLRKCAHYFAGRGYLTIVGEQPTFLGNAQCQFWKHPTRVLDELNQTKPGALLNLRSSLGSENFVDLLRQREIVIADSLHAVR